MLTSDGTHSFVLFLYADDLIQWTTGDITGSNGLGGIPAQCGLNAGDGNQFFSISGSQTAAIINIYSTSNIDVPGIWVFRVDQNAIIHPQHSMFISKHIRHYLNDYRIIYYRRLRMRSRWPNGGR